VAADASLKGRPFVIAGGGRGVAIDCSPEAIRQGLRPGMAVADAQRRVGDLAVLAPDVAAETAMNAELEKVAARYAPVWENDGLGNLYLDISGTTKLFGPPADCAGRVLRDVRELTGIRPAAAAAQNKLVCKVATRTIRPTGLIQVRNGTEGDFLAHQDIRLLPGMGRRLLRTAEVTGITEIGELAALTDGQAAAIFGKHGTLLRSMAMGIDDSGVDGRGKEKRFACQADFEEDTVDALAVRGAITALAENAGLAMRRDRLAATTVRLAVVYADGVKAEGRERLRSPGVFDGDISAVAQGVYRKAALRRVRVRSVGLSLEGLVPLGYEVDLLRWSGTRRT